MDDRSPEVALGVLLGFAARDGLDAVVRRMPERCAAALTASRVPLPELVDAAAAFRPSRGDARYAARPGTRRPPHSTSGARRRVVGVAADSRLPRDPPPRPATPDGGSTTVGRRVPAVPPALAGPVVDPDDLARFAAAVALLHELDVCRPLGGRLPGPLRPPIAPDLEVQATTIRTRACLGALRHAPKPHDDAIGSDNACPSPPGSQMGTPGFTHPTPATPPPGCGTSPAHTRGPTLLARVRGPGRTHRPHPGQPRPPRPRRVRRHRSRPPAAFGERPARRTTGRARLEPRTGVRPTRLLTGPVRRRRNRSRKSTSTLFVV